jgi:hypothetical protein
MSAQLSLAFVELQARKVRIRRVPPRLSNGHGSMLRAEQALATGLLPTFWFRPDGTVKAEFRELAAEATRARRLRAGLQVAS